MTRRATPTRRVRGRLDHESESVPAESLLSQHDDALGRLEGALAEQSRRGRQYEAAFETSDEPNAYARLCAANERVVTRARWLEWVDQQWDRGSSNALARRTS